jgi:hypothetical protein
VSDRYTVASYIYGFPNEGLSGAIVAGAFELDEVNKLTDVESNLGTNNRNYLHAPALTICRLSSHIPPLYNQA